MRRFIRRHRPLFELLECKLALSNVTPLADSMSREPAQAVATRNQNTLQTLQAFTLSYPSTFGGPRYDPAFDLNQNGRVGQDDGRQLLRSLPALGRKRPITLTLSLAPRDRARGTVPNNSGGVTHSMEPTVIGHTSPGALIFTGSGTVDFKLKGPAAVADQNGNFSIKLKMTAGINQEDFQAVDRYGQQKSHAFPIYWLGFRAHENRHPQNL
ncbi:MAG: hypothetical protein ABS79_05610 [Planctomycetes bacterium SCN 63-9]|nr:MAG: hypothetical protein ABS79_05610 [Planctomycetes bacterium SCN 63-9]